jgi:hypothetical protein
MMLAAVNIYGAVAGIAATGASLLVAYWGYKKSQKVDTLAARAGIAQSEAVTTGQVLETMNDIIERVQDDNVYLRAEITKLREWVDARDVLIATLRSEVAAFLKANGIKGNPDLGQEPS